MTETCSLCGKPLDDFKITISLHVETARLTESQTWESIANADIKSREVLCKECFDHFTEVFAREFSK